VIIFELFTAFDIILHLILDKKIIIKRI